jgi:hypothetical protein
MNRLQYSAMVLIGVVLMLLGPITSAFAAMNDTATLPRMSVSSIDVTAPTGVSLAGTKCSSDWNGYYWTTTMHARLDWNPSTTPRGVTGYLVTVVFSDGTRQPYATVPASITSMTGDYDASIQTQNIRVTVTTLTSYGWTEESAISGAVKC